MPKAIAMLASQGRTPLSLIGVPVATRGFGWTTAPM
jgi:hypothetical protein